MRTNDFLSLVDSAFLLSRIIIRRQIFIYGYVKKKAGYKIGGETFRLYIIRAAKKANKKCIKFNATYVIVTLHAVIYMSGVCITNLIILFLPSFDLRPKSK